MTESERATRGPEAGGRSDVGGRAGVLGVGAGAAVAAQMSFYHEDLRARAACLLCVCVRVSCVRACVSLVCARVRGWGAVFF